ncbi:MAG: DUF3726 domain-containing protein [Rhizobiaceae bacterium]
MSWSLGEMRGLAVKGARGIGMPWGLAEEAGFAVKWLEEREIPGVQALSLYLDAIDEYDSANCPVAIGAAISDCSDWRSAFPRKMFQPLLVVPFISTVLGNDSVALKWDTEFLVLNSTGVTGEAGQNTMVDGLHTCTLEEDVISSPSVHRLPRVADNREPFVKKLTKLAHKTYAPSTEESRLLGAGAGLNDND